MCGLILAGGNLTSTDIDLVSRMLIIDTFRGDHSTGVFSKFFPHGQQPITKLVKAAMAGDEFVRSKYFAEAVCIETRTPSKVTNGTDIVSRVFPKALFGHNRYATKGAITAENAHPFQHGHITLAHNGTLLDQSLLPDSDKFAVDSDNIAYAMSVWGVDKTIQNLHGSFTLIWHDAKEQTMNIIRNEDREFHIAETTTGDWFGMSEKWMLLGLLGRGRVPRKIKQSFELEPGVQYVFDVSSGFKFKEERKHELPRFPYYSRYGSAYGWGSSYSSSASSSSSSSASSGGYGAGNSNSYWPTGRAGATSTPSSQTPVGMERYKALMEKHGIHSLSINDKVQAEFFQFDPYPSNQERGKMCGWLPEESTYIEVQVHGAERSVYAQAGNGSIWVELISAFETNHVLTLIARVTTPPVELIDVSEREELDEVLAAIRDEYDDGNSIQGDADFGDDDPDLPPQEEFTASGHRFTREAWERSVHNCCSNCSSPIPFDDVPEVYIIDNPEACFCSECYLDLQEEVRLEMAQEEESRQAAAKKGAGEEGGAASPLTFCCALCTADVPMSQVSERVSVCIECHDHYYGNEDSKRLKNGWLVTRKSWEKMNECHYCHSRIPWAQAGNTRFKFENPVCKNCDGRYPLR